MMNMRHRVYTREEHRPTSVAIGMEDGRLDLFEPRKTDRDPVFSFDNRLGLAHDLGFLASMPELCDITFLVGEDRQPVCGVKAILAARSRIFRRLLFNDTSSRNKKNKKKPLHRPSSDGYVDKNDFRGQPTIVVDDFEPEVFKQLMEYIHTGSVVLQSRTLLGLMNAADHYGLEELKIACVQFLERAINTDTVCVLLSSAEKYIQYKSTKILVQKMLEFVDHHAEVVLTLGSFAMLPQHVVRIVLGRDELLASEKTKYDAAYRWCLRYVEDHPDVTLKTAFEPFVSKIVFHEIPASHLMRTVKPAQVVDDTIILTALAYQADPNSVDSRKLNTKHRRVVHPSSTVSTIQTLESSPPHFRRVKSSGLPIMTIQNESGEEVDGRERHDRSGSVPPSGDLQPDTHQSRVFEIRAHSRTSELSLSSIGSSTSLSSNVPQSPITIRSGSASSYHSNQSNEVDSGRGKSYLGVSNPEFVSQSTSSIV